MAWLPDHSEGNLAQFGNIQLHGGDVSGMVAALIKARTEQQQQPQEIAKLIAAQRDAQIRNQIMQQEADTKKQLADQALKDTYPITVDGQTINAPAASILTYKSNEGTRSALADYYKKHGNYEDAMTNAINSGQRFNSGTQGKTQYTLPDGTVVWLTGNELARMMGANPADQSRAQKQKLDTASGTVSGLLGYDDMDSVRAALSGGATGVPYQAGKTPFPLGQGNDTPGPIKDQIIKAVGDYNAARTGQSPVAQGYGVPPPQAPPAFPPAGTKGTIKGQPVVSDGTGWLPDTP